MSARIIIAQDPDAHKFYDIDWECWLTARGFLADGSEIISVVHTVDAPAIKSHEALNDALSRVWVKSVPIKAKINVRARITLPEPTGGAGNVTDDFTFVLKGTEQ